MKPGRNDPCNCGSGRKYKNCCLGKAEFRPLEPSSDELNQLIALSNAGRHAELESRARALLGQYPNSGFVWKLLGESLYMQGKEARPALQKATELLPGDADAFNNLGIVLTDLGRFDEAAASCRRALKIKPDDARAYNNLGNALKSLGKINDAAASYRRALEIKPDYAKAHNNLGAALEELGRPDEAAASYRWALKIKPDYAEAHSNLGNALINLGQHDGAVACYRRALEIKPDYAEAHYNLGNALRHLGQHDAAVASYRRALELKPDYIDAQSNLLFNLNFMSGQAPDYYLTEARQYSRMVAGKVPARFFAWQCAAKPERLRVGMVSGDLCNHPVGYFLESMLAHLDYTRIELVAYATNSKSDDLTTRIKPFFSAWKPLSGLSDEAAARLIHADGVHVLLDLAGHTAHNRLPVFAWKPAPVQASWLGYFATTGVAEMDYLLADEYVVPNREKDNFTEAIWRLPESYLCFTAPKYDLNVSPLPALTDGCVTFGCFNNLVKMNDAVVDLWVRVLLAVPNSRLFLKTKQLNDTMMCETTRQRFAKRGISPERLLLEGGSPRAELLAAYCKVDIALDPFPYPGGTTSVEGLWMGVPVITRRGNRFLSHVGESIAHNAGLADWIAADDDEYVAKAVEHATDLGRLATLRAGLRQQVLASPVFDAPRFARNFEAALWGMWQTWRDKQAKEKA